MVEQDQKNGDATFPRAPEKEATRLIASFQTAANILNFLVLIIGASVIVGWLFDFELLKSVLSCSVSMKANVALSFILLSVSLWTAMGNGAEKPAYRVAGNLCSSAPILVGALTLLEYVTGWNLGIDQAFIKEIPGALFTPYPGRPSPLTATNLVLMGLAVRSINLRDEPGIHPGHTALFVVGITSLLTFLGHLFNVQQIFQLIPGSTAMAFNTSVGFILMSTAILFARPERGVTAILISDTAGGVLVRRTLFPSIIFMIALGYAIDSGQKAGFYDVASETVINSTLLIVFFSYIILTTAKLLHNTDVEKNIAKMELAESEDKYRQIFDSSGAVVLLIEPETLKIADANDTACGFYGYSKQELLSKTMYEINVLPPSDINAARDAIKKGERAHFTFRHRLASGEVRDVESYPCLIRIGGKPMTLSIVHDITDRKAAEERLKAAKEEAENANSQKDKFVSLVTHDLVSPLAGMLGFLKLVRSDSSGKLSDTSKKMVDASISTAENMAALIQDILGLSRLRTRAMQSQKGFFDASLIGKKMSADYQYMAQSKGITLENAIPDHTSVYSDKTLLTEAIQNFVTNAIKFCGRGDRITISAEKGEQVTIFVSDTGPGMNPALICQLLSHEGYHSTPGTEGEKGTGYGLMMTKEVLDALGCAMLIEPGPEGKGSRFGARVPYVRPRIMVVDDEPIFRKLLMQYLKPLGADIIEAEDGKSATDIIAKGEGLPHLIISDIEMPNMTGLELLSSLQERPETKSIPVIIVSGKHGMEIRDAVYQLGARDYLSKALDVEDFVPRVRRLIS